MHPPPAVLAPDTGPSAPGAAAVPDDGASARQAATAGRSVEADTLRVVAMCAVVLLHAAAPGVARLTLPAERWHLANVLDSLARPAVPIFLMLTGALALRGATAEDPWRFVRRRALPFWVPALFWLVAYAVWDAWRAGRAWHAATGVPALLRGTAHYHLWYVWVAGALLFALPILARWWMHAAARERDFALVIWWGLAVVAPWAGRLWLGGIPKLQPLVVSGYAGFAVLGAWLNAKTFTSRQRRWLQLSGVVALAVTVLGTAQLRDGALRRAARGGTATSVATAPGAATSRKAIGGISDTARRTPTAKPAAPRATPRFDDRYYGYLTPNVALMAIAWWVTIAPGGLARRRLPGGAPRRMSRALAWIADASYPVYLVHPMVLEAIPRLRSAFAPHLVDPAFAVVWAGVAISASLVVVAIGSRLPVVRWVVPVANRRLAGQPD